MKSVGTWFFIFLVAYQFTFYSVLARVRPVLGDSWIQSPWFLILLQMLALLLPLFIWLAVKRERFRDHIPNKKLGITNTAYIITISFFLLPFMSLISALSTFLAPNAAADALGQMQPYSVWALLLAVAVTPAVVEEIVFRGYIQSQYTGWAFWKVALLNGFMFGLIHMNIQQFFYAFAMGVVMAYFVYHTRSIRAGILSHFFLNAINIVMFRLAAWYISWADENIYDTTLQEAAEVSAWATIRAVGVLTLAFLPIAFVLFKAFISYNRARTAHEGDGTE
ncbi:MAG: CPBP family intramembrane metalloprotease [Defluviitaleaceae bacterium]|nr:CPBP family intramembrane metalloprotease [Defluviitaleaceae bacterium]